MGGRHRRYQMVTPAFLGARKRKVLCENSEGHILPSPIWTSACEDLSWSGNQTLIQGKKPNNVTATLDHIDTNFPAIRRNGTSCGLHSPSGIISSSSKERRVYSAPEGSCKHMMNWTLPPKVYAEAKASTMPKKQEIDILNDHRKKHSLPDKNAIGSKLPPNQVMYFNRKPVTKRDSAFKTAKPETDFKLSQKKLTRPSEAPEIKLLKLKEPSLYQRLVSNRTRFQTWHRLPVYPCVHNTTNVSALYMRPHHQLPTQFLIHPEWGM